MAATKLLLLLCLTSISLSVSSNVIQLPCSNANNDLHCPSWRLSVEANNAGAWKVVPEVCGSYVKEYMRGLGHWNDSKVVAANALSFAKSIKVVKERNDTWVFDVGDTLISSEPYYAEHGHGTEPFNQTSFDEWESQGEAPAISLNLNLYYDLKRMGFKIILVTGREESQRAILEKNLRLQGYTGWDELFMRRKEFQGISAANHKGSILRILAWNGYTIQGNYGDQWSDLFNDAWDIPCRHFKFPNTMYHIA